MQDLVSMMKLGCMLADSTVTQMDAMKDAQSGVMMACLKAAMLEPC